MENKSKRDYLIEALVGLGCFVLAAVYFALSFMITNKAVTNLKTNSIEPTLFPRAISLIAAVVSLTMFVPAFLKYLKTPADNGVPDEVRPKVITQDRLVIWGCMIAYLILVKPLGYMISTFLLSAVLLNYVKREKWIRNLIFSLAFSVICYLVFNNVLSIWLPQGFLGDLF